jgi:hypothetical protein
MRQAHHAKEIQMNATSTAVTAKQIEFLQKLFAERTQSEEAMACKTVANYAFKARNFSRKQASDMIEYLLTLPRDPRPVAAVTASSDPVPSDLISGRIYVNAKGQIVKAVKGRSGRFYAKVRVPGGWDYLPGGLAGARNLTAEEAAAYGHEHDRCVFCHTPLTDDGPDRSVHVGYGPVCAKKYDLPWG